MFNAVLLSVRCVWIFFVTSEMRSDALVLTLYDVLGNVEYACLSSSLTVLGLGLDANMYCFAISARSCVCSGAVWVHVSTCLSTCLSAYPHMVLVARQLSGENR